MIGIQVLQSSGNHFSLNSSEFGFTGADTEGLRGILVGGGFVDGVDLEGCVRRTTGWRDQICRVYDTVPSTSFFRGCCWVEMQG